MSRGVKPTKGFQSPKDRPKTRGHLERLVDQYSHAERLAPGRVRRWISTVALLGALERVERVDGPAFIVKGGVAMELRIRLRARATKDLDLVFRCQAGRDEDAVARALTDALDVAFEDAYSSFTFRRRAEPEAIRDTGSYRLEVALDYAGRSWQTLQIEASPPEGSSDEPEFVASAISIDGFLLGAPGSVAVLAVRYQIAQKLHAVTAQHDDRVNDRAYDLIDLQLLEELVVELEPVRAACVEIFEGRARQPWPPVVVVQPGWDELYERAARDLNFPVTDVQEAAERVRASSPRSISSNSSREPPSVRTRGAPGGPGGRRRPVSRARARSRRGG